MPRNLAAWLCVAGLIVTIVSVDVLFFRGRPLVRLAANIGTVLVFALVSWYRRLRTRI